jgi:hypothetical protein
MSDTSNSLDLAATETPVSPGTGAPFSDETIALFQSFNELGGEDLTPEQLTQLLELSPSNPLNQSGMTSEEIIALFESFESGAETGSGEAIEPPSEFGSDTVEAIASSTSASSGFSTEEANALLLQSPFAPLAEVVGEDNLISIFDNVGVPGSNPFAGSGGSAIGGNPFSGGSGGAIGGNPFAGGESEESGSSPAEEETGSAPGSSEDLNQQLRQSPFGRLTEVLGDDLSSIFSGVSGGGEGENPFGGAAPGGGSNADLPYGGNPFAGENFNNIFGGGASIGGGNPFAGGTDGAGGGGNPFAGGTDSAGGGSNPFAGGTGGGGNPFAGGAGGGSNPFAGGTGGGGNPFAGGTGGGGNPFAGGAGGGNPFAGGAGGGNPFEGGAGGGNPFAGGAGGGNPFAGGAGGGNPFAGGAGGGNPFADGSSNPFLDGMSLLSESDELLSVEGDSQLTIRGVNSITTDAANDSGGSSGNSASISGGSNNQTDFAGINNIVLGNDVQFGVGDDIEFDIENASGSTTGTSEPTAEDQSSPYFYDFSGNGGSTTGGSALIGGSGNDNYFAGINNLIMGTDIQFAVGKNINYEIISKTPSESKTVLGGSANRNYFAGINNLILGSNISFAVGEDLDIKIDRTPSAPSGAAPSSTSGAAPIMQPSGNGDRQMYQGIDTLLMGTSLDEIINGGTGGAMLIGGEGEDDFLIARGVMPKVPSTIADFEIGSDIIRISGVPGINQFSDLSLTAEANGTMISFGGQNMTFLSGISTNDLSSSSFAINPV